MPKSHICVSDLTNIGSDNGLSPGRCQAIIRTNAGILLIRPLGTNFSEFLVEILIVSFKKMCLKVSSAKRRPFCLGLNQLNTEMTQGTRACLSYTDNTMATDDPDVQESWESAAMISTCYPGIICLDVSPRRVIRIWEQRKVCVCACVCVLVGVCDWNFMIQSKKTCAFDNIFEQYFINT